MKPLFTRIWDAFNRRIWGVFIGKVWRDRIIPINGFTFSILAWQTIAEDLRSYQPQKRAITQHRISALLKPNLDAPIFIVGAPRSGTTFLGSCLGVLPELSYHLEPVLTKAATRYVYLNLWNKKFAQNFYRGIYGWLMRLHLDADLIFLEKTPQISLIIPFLRETFPHSKFIHIIRDGRDSAISLSKKSWYINEKNGSGERDPDGYPKGSTARCWVEPERVEEYETTNNLHRCIWLWRRYLEEIMEGVSSLESNRYHELKYEDLVNKPNLEAEKLLNFLDIQAPDSRLELKNTLVTRANPSSVGRWKNESSTTQREAMLREAGDCLRHLGYESVEISA